MSNEVIKAAFAKRLRRLLKEAGLKQVEFVALVQEEMPEHGRFERGNLSVYLAGKSLPRPLAFHAMCRALEVEPRQLLPSMTKDRVTYGPKRPKRG